MKELKKKIIQVINNTDITSHSLFGDLVFKIVFNNNALIITPDDNICALSKNDKANDSHSLYLKINYVLSLLDELTRNSLIICIPHTDKPESFPSIYFKDKKDISIAGGSLNNKYQIGESLNLLIDTDNNSCIITRSNMTEYSGEMIKQTSLSRKIDHYFSSFIYPTYDLINYINKGYRTNEELSIYHSKVAIYVAVIVACLSPVLSILINNWIGQTTIKEEQFEILSDKTVVVDTILNQNNVSPTLFTPRHSINPNSESTNKPKK